MADPKKLSIEEIQPLLAKHEDWFFNDEKNRLVTGVEFENFNEAVAFMPQIAKLADKLGHHPDVYIYDYKYMQLLLHTHDVDGFSQKDVEFVEKFDKLFGMEEPGSAVADTDIEE